MKRDDVARELAAAAPTHVVLTSLGSAARAWRESGRGNLTYYGSDPMGAAPALALGAAVARPDLEFLLLEGDGDLTMNLGALLAISGTAPPNLRMVVFANGRYETGGGQSLCCTTDIAALASVAGWPWTQAVEAASDIAGLRRTITGLLRAPAPAALVVGIDPEPAPYGGPGEESGAEARARFQMRLRDHPGHDQGERL